MNEDNSVIDAGNKLKSPDPAVRINAVERIFREYSEILLRVIKKKLPPELAKKLDPADVLQSMLRSFIRKPAGQKSHFEYRHKLLAYLSKVAENRVTNLGTASRRKERDVRIERPLECVENGENVNDLSNSQDYRSNKEYKLVVDDFVNSLQTYDNRNSRNKGSLLEIYLLFMAGLTTAKIAKEFHMNERHVQRQLKELIKFARESRSVRIRQAGRVPPSRTIEIHPGETAKDVLSKLEFNHKTHQLEAHSNPGHAFAAGDKILEHLKEDDELVVCLRGSR